MHEKLSQLFTKHSLMLTSLQGADLNVLDSEERTPLMLAVLRSSWAAAHTLIQLGAEANIPDLGGRTLLHFLVINTGRVDDLLNASPVSKAWRSTPVR